MRKGELQQAAEPQELYDHPVNLFVAGFIGSPAMNMALKQEQKIIDETHAKAREVETWMHSTQPLMEVVSAVINSVKSGNTLSSLKLSRTADKPEHVEMRIEINSGGTTQKEETVQALVKQGYQTFRDDLISPNKNDRNSGDVTYTATLVKAAAAEE